MKKLLFLAAAVVVGFIIYSLLSEVIGTSGGTSATSPTPAPLSPTPFVASVARRPAVQQTAAPVRPTRAAQPTPNPYVQRGPRQSANRPTPTRPAQNPVDKRSAEIRRIIYECARRADWKITRYNQTAYGVSRVTGHAPNDNVRNQRFIDEIQRSGILLDIDTGPRRVFMARDQRRHLESTFIIKWK